MDYRALPVFADAAAWWRPEVNLKDAGLEPARVKAIETSGNLFAVLGVGAQVGAGFPKDGPFFARERIAVISDRLWRTRYQADPSLVGRTVQLSGVPYTIAGVMPRGFHFPDDVDVWERLQWDLAQHSRHARFMEGVARLKEDTSIEQARAAADTLAVRLGREFEASDKGWAFALQPLLHDQLGYYRPALYVLFGAVGLLFVIGCLNVASLLLTRAISREREIAVRRAIGAAPRQIVMQLLAESLFTPQDTPETEAVAVVNETLAKRYFAGRSALGGVLLDVPSQIGPLGRDLKWTVAADGRRRTPPRGGWRVIGVVADIQNQALGLPVEPAVYLTTRQFPFGSLSLAIAAPDRATAVPAVRTALKAVSPATPLGTVETWPAHLGARTAEPRLLMTTLTAFGLLAAALAALGVHDPVSIASGAALLVAAAILASLPPAWRAMRVDPVAGLRAE